MFLLWSTGIYSCIMKQKQKQYMEDENYPQKLGNQMRTSKMESQNSLIVKYIDTQQEIARSQKKKKDTRKCYECGQIEHIVRDCKIK